MDLSKIGRKVSSARYASGAGLLADLEQIARNAEAYNATGCGLHGSPCAFLRCSPCCIPLCLTVLITASPVLLANVQHAQSAHSAVHAVIAVWARKMVTLCREYLQQHAAELQHHEAALARALDASQRAVPDRPFVTLPVLGSILPRHSLQTVQRRSCAPAVRLPAWYEVWPDFCAACSVAAFAASARRHSGHL